jgi:NAD(P)-dependent dehydrogenase (short-subunit alcohol dehydrogenase family)
VSTESIRFDGKVAVIVGAGPGLGATLGGRLAAAGAEVALVARSDRSLDAAGAAARAAGRDALTIRADCSVRTDVERMAGLVIDRFGRVDVLVKMAFGGTRKRRVLDMEPDDLEDWRRAVEVGGFGTLLPCRYLAPTMVEQGRGAIVNVTSMSSRLGFAGRSDWAAGKVQAHRIT